MKLVQINSCDNGSTGKIMLDIFDALDDSVEKTAYVSRKYTDREYVKRMHTRTQYRVHKFLSMYLALDDFGSYFTSKKVIRELEKNKPDILHLHNIHNHTINYQLLFKYIKKFNVNVVWTLHDCWAFTGGCFYFELNGCMKWKEGCSKCQFLKDTATLTPIDSTARYYRKKRQAFTGVKNMILVTPSKWLANLVGQSYLKDYKLDVINNGINLNNFNRCDYHSFDNIVDRNKKILLGVAASFNDKRKGFYDYIKLAKILDEKYQIVLVGISDEQRSILPNNVIGIKRTENQRQLAELYSLAYAFLNFTYEDNFPTVNIEALACGAPVICYQTGGATEMLSDDNSIVLKQGDYQGVLKVLDKIDVLRNNKDIYMARVKEEYSSKRMTTQYKEIYKKLIEKVGIE